MTDEQVRTFQALSQKRNAIVSLQQFSIPPGDKSNLGAVVSRAESELQRVNLTIGDLLASAPLSFPSRDELDKILRFAAIVSWLAQNSKHTEDLAAAGGELINTWPV